MSDGLQRLRSATRAWKGVARSLLIYHARPAHIRGLKRLYGRFVTPGELAFDVGAHVGDRTRALAGLGARVVAVEPQPRLMACLRLLFGRRSDVVLVEAALGESEGEIELHLNTANPTVSSASFDLRKAALQDARWQGQIWDEVALVRMTTLDDLIAAHGEPVFVKIDVEGLEDQVLKGLSRRVGTLSFEFTTLQRDVGLKALERCATLGYRRFNLSLGESHAMEFADPVDRETLAQAIAALPDEANSGDVYCFETA
ncbi:MAG: FkbM family methyltransferase [Fulvimarina manganoxydans]|uniref:FkbM family methyltransferase n=1 Tax=Fulvimarina manganoxydans TaxID=937218 RepID=UPI00235392A6|nr:FkbM family methyltransferase [Fulvimarina manganoxydans]MCK5932624.1 FkbM family methyltransferase [Fulvimarina manganoxydans]